MTCCQTRFWTRKERAHHVDGNDNTLRDEDSSGEETLVSHFGDHGEVGRGTSERQHDTRNSGARLRELWRAENDKSLVPVTRWRGFGWSVLDSASDNQNEQRSENGDDTGPSDELDFAEGLDTGDQTGSDGCNSHKDSGASAVKRKRIEADRQTEHTGSCNEHHDCGLAPCLSVARSTYRATRRGP